MQETTQSRFPLVPRADGRCLVDNAGIPFFYHADTAWFLLLKRTPDEAEEYIRRRQGQGFTALQIQLTGFVGMTDFAGNAPFEGEWDLSRPNEAFFCHVDEVLARAENTGIFVAIAPLWSGCCGEGWAGKRNDGSIAPMNVSGPEVCRAFGRWLGTRYARHRNILWILGGDNDPHNAYEEIIGLAEGLRATAPHHLLTYHAASTHSSTDVFPDAKWLDVSMTYTYFRGFNKAWNKVQPDVYEAHFAEGRKQPRKPFFLGESTYEGEHEAWGSPLQVRKQAYWSVLSGGIGHAYGSVNWRQEANWREVIGFAGAESLRHLPALLEPYDWASLIPDEIGQTVNSHSPDGYGRNDYAMTAVLADGSAAICYVPSPRPLRLTEEWNVASLFDPTSGEMQEIPRTPEILPPPANAAGDSDFVVVLRR